MRVQRPSKRTLIVAASLTLLAAIPLVNAVRTNSASAADAVAGDGTTPATAGASCWGIKQQYASSATGTYWLNSAALARPQQFWCDMATDGGGWVLIGRGRDGWTFNPLGQGSAATVRGTTDGQAAFAPAALDTGTINDLLAGQTVDTLTDGIRLERSTATDGSTRQDYRLYPQSKHWTWSLPAGQLLTKVAIDGTTYLGSNTANTTTTAYGQTTNALSGVTGARQLFTTAWANHHKVQGFSFGSGVKGGSNAASNHLWTYGTEGSPLAFTRVWIRPRVANDAAGFTPLPSAGLPAQPLPAQLKSKSEAAPWGVVGLDHTDEPTIEPYNTTVLAMKVTADRTFVGGRFTGVQNGPTASPVAQAHLAAFDLDGNWISSFRPTVDGRVWNIVATPDGKLIIAGDFTNVNGVANTAGLAALDPRTGEVITGWKANIARSNGSRPLVRALALRGTTLYAAGTFNRVTAGTWSTISVTNAISLSTANGNPGTWRPRPSASTVDLRVTDNGARVLMAGYFADINGDTNQGYFGITDAATGSPTPGIGAWIPSTGSSAKYQQAVLDLGDGRIMVGGSEHDDQVWDRDRTKLIDSTITKQGGDTQALELFDGKVYLGCHCGDWVYQGTNNWSSPTGFRSVEAINLVGAFDAGTFEYDTGWYPSGLKGEKGEGIWAIDKDSRGCLWVGGDLVRGAYSGDAATDWLGGFARFCAADATAPTPPANLRSTPSGGGTTVSWAASTDDSGTVSYDVYRNDRVIATVWGTSYDDPSVTGTQRYTVRAVDARGNRSAAPAPISVNGPSPKIATAIAFGSTWRYADSGADQGTAWRSATFADSAWKRGPARLGWGTTDLATTLTAKPQTAYLRSSFDVADPASVRVVELRLKVATGAVVYVNGVEAGRVNMPAGKITSTSPAAAYVAGAAETATNTVVVPGTMLVAGSNSIAVELHAMTAGATRGFFDLEATTYGSGGDAQAPAAPGVSASASTGRVDLTWTAATDDTALGGYLISRDGTTIAATGPTAMGYVDGEVDTTGAHTYVVTAYDTNGNTAPSGPVATKAQVNSALLAYGAVWRWSFTEAGQATGWAAPGFDDSTWATGPAELGFGDGDEKTVISTAAAPRPLTGYFRITVTVDDPAAFQSVLAELIRDDGAVVYVNGVEVGRDNMPAGPVTGTTKAPVAITDRTAERTPVSISVPASAFVPGANTIAVEVHGNDRYTGDLSFDLKLTGRP
ncbi:fibrinogen-like YCDxxxxGGGW domain-containing protein [Aquihabitans sp. McL0605]|uniref:fibrinogen-like YCDxxxxGGGW domain-containing protein n=1 Tax=Aquihabitans sp. McL0605 TaxID=3415671 RepID=UPI003CF36094